MSKPLTPMAREAKLKPMALDVYGPDDTRPIPNAGRAFTAGCLKRRGRMAEEDPGDYLAAVLPFPALSVRSTSSAA